MKILHLADLHLGKRVNGFSMLEDQAYILNQIENIAAERNIEAILIAGDVYDKSIPPTEAVELFNDFLCHMSEKGRQVFVISGNHDSPERLAFGGRLMDPSGIHLAPVYDGTVDPVVVNDHEGEVAFYLVPFIKPIHVRQALGDETIKEYTQAMARVIKEMKVDRKRRNVILAHQFVTGAVRSESEEHSVGGLDNVDGSVFEGFDYVALGHLHRPQQVAKENMRYAGSPLAYAFGEGKKSVTMIDLEKKGEISVEEIPLTPLRAMVEVRGSYMELTSRTFYESRSRDDYYHITLTDEETVVDGAAKLRTVYPNLMRLDYDNQRTRAGGIMVETSLQKEEPPLAVMERLYQEQNGKKMDEGQKDLLCKLIEEIWNQEGEEIL